MCKVRTFYSHCQKKMSYDINPLPSDMIQSDMTRDQPRIWSLSESSFYLNTSDPIKMIFTNCITVLFHDNGQESLDLLKVIRLSAERSNGPIFAACNCEDQPGVANAFYALNHKPDHPFYPFALKGYPFILVYRNGYPQAFYNGARTVNDLSNFTLTLACQVGYKEDNMGYGTDFSGRNAGIPGYNVKRRPTSSLDFDGELVRTYKPEIDHSVKNVSIPPDILVEVVKQKMSDPEFARRLAAALEKMD